MIQPTATTRPAPAHNRQPSPAGGGAAIFALPEATGQDDAGGSGLMAELPVEERQDDAAAGNGLPSAEFLAFQPLPHSLTPAEKVTTGIVEADVGSLPAVSLSALAMVPAARPTPAILPVEVPSPAVINADPTSPAPIEPDAVVAVGAKQAGALPAEVLIAEISPNAPKAAAKIDLPGLPANLAVTDPTVRTAATAAPLPVISPHQPPLERSSSAKASGTLAIGRDMVSIPQLLAPASQATNTAPSVLTIEQAIAASALSTQSEAVRTDRSDLPIAPSAPLPAAAVVGTTAPAAIVFGAAKAASQRDERDGALALSTASDPLPAVAAGADWLAVAAVANGGAQAGLDMRDQRWPHAMMAQIEALRDAADAVDTRIRLVPDALGSIDVGVRREGDTLHVRFTAEQAQTRALLQDAQPRLAEAAEARGMRLGQASVDAGASGQGQQRQPMPTEPRRPAPAVTTRSADAEPADDGRLA